MSRLLSKCIIRLQTVSSISLFKCHVFNEIVPHFFLLLQCNKSLWMILSFLISEACQVASIQKAPSNSIRRSKLHKEPSVSSKTVSNSHFSMKKSKTFDIWNFIYSIQEILTKPKSLEFKSSKIYIFNMKRKKRSRILFD